MPDPRQLDFWNSELDDWFGDLGDLVLEIYLTGTEGAIGAFPARLRGFIDLEAALNTRMLDFVRGYRFEQVAGIVQTTIEQTQKAYDAWLTLGAPLPTLERMLEPIFGESRAATIATTETTRIFAQGNMETWEDTQVVGSAVWMTSQDELVCPICSERDGEHVGLGDLDSAPPAHPNCRCWLQPEVSEEMLEQRLDRILGL